MAAVRASKKGGTMDLVLSPILVLILIMAGFFIPSLTKVSNVFSEDYYRAAYLTMDMGLIPDTLAGFPGYAKITYDNNLEGYKFHFNEKDLTTFYFESKTSEPAYKYPIIGERGVTFFGGKFEKLKDPLYFVKDRSGIYVSKDDLKYSIPIACEERKVPLSKIMIHYEESDADFVGRISRQQVGVKDVIFSTTPSKNNALLLKIKKDPVNTDRISVMYPARIRVGPTIACKVLVNVVSRVGDLKVKEANYFPGEEYILYIGTDYLNNPKEIGDGIYAFLRETN